MIQPMIVHPLRMHPNVVAGTAMRLFAATSPPVRAGIVLFDEAHGRVLVVCGDTIEDAREFSVAVDLGRSRCEASAAQRRRLRRAWIQERAAQTSRLVIDLHASHPLDGLLVAGPTPIAPILLWQYLPARLGLRLSGVLKLPAGAGESAILAAVLPALETMVIDSLRALPRRPTMPYDEWESLA